MINCANSIFIIFTILISNIDNVDSRFNFPLRNRAKQYFISTTMTTEYTNATETHPDITGSTIPATSTVTEVSTSSTNGQTSESPTQPNETIEQDSLLKKYDIVIIIGVLSVLCVPLLLVVKKHIVCINQTNSNLSPLGAELDNVPNYPLNNATSNEHNTSASYISRLSCQMDLSEHTQIDLLISSSNISVQYLIGDGQFGYVHKDVNGSQIEVALKFSKSKWTNMDPDLLNEAMQMKSFDHANVMSLYGVSFDNSGKIFVVMQFLKNGDLLSYIKNNQVNFSTILKFSLDIAHGMNYLSENNFVHRDLAARNCLLDDNLNVKISDFGLTKNLMDSTYYKPSHSSHRMPIRWMAIESIVNNKYSVKSDVWSYGVVLWEMMSKAQTLYKSFHEFSILIFAIQNGYRLENSPEFDQDLYDLCTTCWQSDPNSRPYFNEIIVKLNEIELMPYNVLPMNC